MARTTTSDGVELYYEVSGEGETVVFIGEAGLGAWQWGWQYRQLAGPYEVLTWDLRGTGRSGGPTGTEDVGRFATDLEAVLSATSTSSCHLIGAGLGGMIALSYARRYNRASSVTLFNAAATGELVAEPALRTLCSPDGTTAGARRSLSIGFSNHFLDANADLLSRIRDWRREEDADSAALDVQIEALCSFDGGPLYEITTPTLVCHGLDDPVVPVSAGESLADRLPRGMFEPVEGRHLCFIEHSRAVTDRVVEFLEADHDA